MKAISGILLFVIFNSAQSQSLSQTVISSSGEFSTGSATSLSWTLGEIAIETFSNSNNILTQGFQQPIGGVVISFDLDLLVFLEGPFINTEMVTSLNSEGLIPKYQPYTDAPWNYSGSESVLSIPNPNVVDWVLVELRDAATANAATPATRIARQAAFLLKNGSIVGTDGSSILTFNNSFSENLFVIVWHRNHLGIMSSIGLTVSGGVYTYNFSTDASKVHGGSAGYKNISSTIWGMVAGDSNHDGLINLNDKSEWASFAGKSGYLDPEFTMDSQVNNRDKDEIWIPNTSKSEQVPD